MSRTCTPNPCGDRHVVEKLEEVQKSFRAAVTDVLVEESTFRNMSKDTFNAVEIVLRDLRLQVGYAILAISSRRIQRARLGHLPPLSTDE